VSAPVDRASSRSTGNPFAFLTLMCGIASWVPLIVVITGPLTLLFFVLAHVSAPARTRSARLHAAWTGLVLAALAFAVQAAFTGLAAIPGLLFAR
jgi:hypothetical protein